MTLPDAPDPLRRAPVKAWLEERLGDARGLGVSIDWALVLDDWDRV